MAELIRLSADDITARLAKSARRPPEAEPSVSGARWAYREACALLGFFTAESLESSKVPGDPEALRELVTQDCERVATRAGFRWRLRRPVRDATVRRLATRDRLLAALALAPADPSDIARVMSEAYVAGDPLPLERQTIEQLHGTLQAAECLSGSDVPVPTADEVRGRLAVVNLLQPLRRLVGPSFVGREAELKRLADYVGVMTPGPDPSQVVPTGSGADDPTSLQKPPLVIHGPGGIGKSTLVGRFVLDHADQDPRHRFPFAYLSFDRMDLHPNRPLTLLAEAVRQLGAQYPAMASEALDLEQAVRATLVSQTAAQRDAGAASKSASSAVRHASRDGLGLLGRFASLVGAVTGQKDAPVLWVLDTFEQAQRHGPLAVSRVWDFLEELQSEIPRVRVVFAGRAPLEGYVTDELPLTGLDDKLALLLLRKELAGIKGLTKQFMESVVRQVSNNPLSLKLAAELIRREGATGLRSVSTQRRILLKVSADEVQGLLYRRILDHLDDPELRRIANPGLVVRFVTPEIIAEVLAVPCGLGPIDPDQARRLFDALQYETSLFESVAGEDDVVKHRADVRLTMLPLLERDRRTKVRSIHTRAIRYYKTKEGAQARAEELYHRMSLGQSTATLDKRWVPEAGPLLESALEELPPAGRVYLADRLKLPSDPETLAAADDEAWSRQAVRIARELLEAKNPAGALELVRQRQGPRVRAQVTALEVEALAYLGRMDEALELVESSLGWAAAEGRTSTFIDLGVLGARIAEDTGRYKDAAKALEQVRSAAEHGPDRVVHLATGVALLRVHRRAGTPATAKAKRLRIEVVEAARTLTSREKAEHPSLVRDLAAEIGVDLPELVRDATRLVGLDVEGDAGRILDSLLSSDEVDDFATFVQENYAGSQVDEVVGVDVDDDGRLKIQQTVSGRTIVEQGQQVLAYLENDPSDRWANVVSEAYRSEADQAAF